MLKQQAANREFYQFINEDFKAAFDFLKAKELETLEAGRIDITDRVFAIVQEYQTKPEDQVKWEAHKKYFDIQYIVSGAEKFFIIQKSKLSETVPYDEGKDIAFFGETSECADLVILKPGDLVIVGPEEAHKPCCMIKENGFVKKIVVKVPVVH
jgi:YhcH/YjgK/YiaL family protein